MRQAARLFLIGILSVILGMTAIACGSGDGESVRLYDQDNLVDTFALDAPDSAAWSRSRLEVQGVQGAPGAPGLPGAIAIPAPAPTTAPQMAAVPTPTPAAAMAARPARGELLESISESEQPQAQLVTDRRIIIREVDMDLVVEDIQVAIDRIADIAVDAGGWVVDSSRYSLHRGGVSIRVPAQLLRCGHRRSAADGQEGPGRADVQQGRHRRIRRPRSEAEERAGGGSSPARPP